MEEWKTTWSYVPVDYSKFKLFTENHIQKISIRNNLAGNKIRLLFSNRYGNTDLKLEKVSIAIKDILDKEKKISVADVTLNGDQNILIPADKEIYSDDINISCKPNQIIKIETTLKNTQELGSLICIYDTALTIIETTPLSMPVDIDLTKRAMMSVRNCNWIYGVKAVEVETAPDVCVCDTFGDSLTHMSYWSSVLALNLYDMYPGKISFTNSGVSGNRICYGTVEKAGLGEICGDSALKRIRNDTFLYGKRDIVILFEGINDIILPYEWQMEEEKVTAQILIDAYKELAGIIHSFQAQAVICTLLPYYGSLYFNEEGEQIREEVNSWILNNNVFDKVFDTEKMIMDNRVKDNKVIKDEFHIGDYLHVNKRGGRQIADCLMDHITMLN